MNEYVNESIKMKDGRKEEWKEKKIDVSNYSTSKWTKEGECLD